MSSRDERNTALAGVLLAVGCASPMQHTDDVGAVAVDAPFTTQADSALRDAPPSLTPDAALCGAQPLLMRVDSTFAHGAELTVEGGCFGERAQPAPLLFDDAEHAYTDVREGADVPVGEAYPFLSVGGAMHFATTSRPLRGVSTAHYVAYGAEHKSNFFRARDYNPDGLGHGHPEFYVSWLTRIDTASAAMASAKLLRLWAGDHNGRTYRLNWTTEHLTYAYAEDQGTAADRYASTTHEFVVDWDTWDGEEALTEWHRQELYFRQSSGPDVADGRLLMTTDGRIEHDLTIPTWRAEQSAPPDAISTRPRFGNDPPNRIGVIGFDPSVPVGDYIAELDDIYIDATRARVELCDTATWSTRAGAHCELQPSRAWSDARITVQMNRGALEDGWLYVVRGDAAVNEAGFRVDWE